MRKVQHSIAFENVKCWPFTIAEANEISGYPNKLTMELSSSMSTRVVLWLRITLVLQEFVRCGGELQLDTVVSWSGKSRDLFESIPIIVKNNKGCGGKLKDAGISMEYGNICYSSRGSTVLFNIVFPCYSRHAKDVVPYGTVLQCSR